MQVEETLETPPFISTNDGKKKPVPVRSWGKARTALTKVSLCSRLTAEGQNLAKTLGDDLTPRPLLFEEVTTFLGLNDDTEDSPPASEDETASDKPSEPPTPETPSPEPEPPDLVTERQSEPEVQLEPEPEEPPPPPPPELEQVGEADAVDGQIGDDTGRAVTPPPPRIPTPLQEALLELRQKATCKSPPPPTTTIHLRETPTIILLEVDFKTLSGEMAWEAWKADMVYYRKTYGEDSRRHRSDNVGQTPPRLHRDAATNTILTTLVDTGAPVKDEVCNTTTPSIAKLRASAVILERVITSNYARRKQMKIMSRAPVAVGPWPEITRLFRWNAPHYGQDETVTCLAWNVDPTLMAVAHGTLHWASSEDAFGIVRVWSLKNRLHPEREYLTPAPVSVISFAPHRPAVLTIGCRGGQVFMVSLVLPEQPLQPVRPFHTAPITAFLWLQFPSEKFQLASAAGDGKILIRPLQPSTSPNCPPHPPTSVHLPRFPAASGSVTALAKHALNPDKLLVGTVCGQVFLVLVSRRGPVGGFLRAHQSAVSALERSPFAPEMFVSSGADGDMVLWHEADDGVASDAWLVRRFKCGAFEPVESCAWSPTHATLLAVLMGSRVQVWDVRRETPVAAYDTGERCSALAFNSYGDRLLIGAASGHVRLFQLSCTAAPKLPRAALLKALRFDM